MELIYQHRDFTLSSKLELHDTRLPFGLTINDKYNDTSKTIWLDRRGIKDLRRKLKEALKELEA